MVSCISLPPKALRLLGRLNYCKSLEPGYKASGERKYLDDPDLADNF